MNKAVAILKKAQSILADRLCEYLVENEDSYLESVSGADLGLHNDVWELADKLRDLNIILSIMPNEPDPPSQSQSQVQVVQSDGGTVVQSPPQLTYGSFISYVESGNFSAAAVVLSHLFQLGVVRAEDCTRFFASKWASDPDTYFKALEVPAAVRNPNDESLRLLHDLFGLQGMEIAHVFRATQQTIGPPT